MGRTASRKNEESIHLWVEEENYQPAKSNRHERRSKRHKEKAVFRDLVKGAIDPSEITDFDDLEEYFSQKR